MSGPREFWKLGGLRHQCSTCRAENGWPEAMGSLGSLDLPRQRRPLLCHQQWVFPNAVSLQPPQLIFVSY